MREKYYNHYRRRVKPDFNITEKDNSKMKQAYKYFKLYLVFLISVSFFILLGGIKGKAEAAESVDEVALPEFFGVYAKTNDGKLVELRTGEVYEYVALAGSGLGGFLNADLKPRKYFVGTPEIILNPEEIEGFYVYGNRDITTFSVAQFISASKCIKLEGPCISDMTTGPGPNNSNAYVDGDEGWALEKSFRYVEIKPKLYWVKPCEETNIALSSRCDDFFLAIRIENVFWPFGLTKTGMIKKNSAASVESTDSTGIGSSRFTKKEGVIYDTKTGLEWTLGPNRPTTYEEAEEWVRTCQTAGGGWSLPTRKELEELCIKEQEYNIDPVFLNGGIWIWTCERNDKRSVWCFDFSTGTPRWYITGRYIEGHRVFGVRSRRMNAP